VRLDRVLVEEHVLGDLGVGEPAGDLEEHVTLAVGELTEAWDPARPRRLLAREPGDPPAID
jgi:hypothetical protein